MSDEIKMSVSSMTRTKDKKALYVQFQDNTRMAEFELPELKLVYNKGFMDEEINQLMDYIKNETDYIYSLSKGVNPIKAIMKDN
ncbi:MAG: hypothetical protein E7271_10620 [Lachnospiraceae bacterium]|jgi:competence transcription factor ComK|nr:hypothetical protein [Lachnospiraceae bacterium]